MIYEFNVMISYVRLILRIICYKCQFFYYYFLSDPALILKLKHSTTQPYTAQ